MFKIADIKLNPAHSEEDLYSAVASALNTPLGNIKTLNIIKKAVDARREPVFVYSVAVSLTNEDGIIAENYEMPKPLTIPQAQGKSRPVVVGMGPAGLFAAYILARAGMNPIVLERGKPVDDRIKDVELFNKTGSLNENSNVQFGEGGAGTFSDGKLNTGIKSPFIREVLNTFYECGAPEEILYSSKPHIGSDRLIGVVKSLREKIIMLGAELCFETTLTDIIIENGRLAGIVTDKGEIFTDTLVLAIGHSARDTFKMIFDKGLNMIAKPFSIGARIEHRQDLINRGQYGKYASGPYLPSADYKLSCHLNSGFSVYTFCMCPGGYVSAAASEHGGVVTNGYSKYQRNGENANSALLVGITPEIFGTHPLSGIEFQRKAEKAAFLMGGSSYKAPCQRLKDFMRSKPSIDFGKVKPTYERGVVPSDINGCLPAYITEQMREGIRIFARKIHDFDNPDAILTAPETRSSSPLRIVRNENGESSVKGIYPTGEGSGYAGGIMSSAVDGIKAALSIILKTASKQ